MLPVVSSTALMAAFLIGIFGPAFAGESGTSLRVDNAAQAAFVRGASRIKDIAKLQVTRDNQLVGYGLVVGLQGTGDGLRSAPFTRQSLQAMLTRLGIASGDDRVSAKNVAAVIVTTNLPAFVETGTRLDTTVSSIGDATSLRGGTLVMTMMQAGDGEVYAAAQGNVIVSGFQAEGDAQKVTQGVPTTGRVPNGAIVEKALPASFSNETNYILQLRNPDFSTAVAMADTINAHTASLYGYKTARERDARTIQLSRPKSVSSARFIASIENLPVAAQSAARVVLDERTGTVVIGAEVRISRVAVSHGALTVRITERPVVVQPEAFSDGVTAVEPATDIEVASRDGTLSKIEGTSLDVLIQGLNELGVDPQQTIAIIQAIKTAGALQAELVIQ
ncbi:flagellar basal body P-ring protein FlgI [Ahrensia sp. R2A130]|uniref:flagellar basal body P-ring protein FlgI n=1 Tax=Ahrensia sp. R2A130 TaxID=744979 RepID=UPI0001E083C3|nr:flagellar P-ring protein FlgI [Ahrensia sp. R2A130]